MGGGGGCLVGWCIYEKEEKERKKKEIERGNDVLIVPFPSSPTHHPILPTKTSEGKKSATTKQPTNQAAQS